MSVIGRYDRALVRNRRWLGGKRGLLLRFEVPVAWAPTLELTVHVRGVPAAGPLRCRFRNRFMQNGLFEEDGEIWDSRGAIVAQSRQLALIPRE